MANVEFSQRIRVIKSGFLKDRHYTLTDIGIFIEPFPNANGISTDKLEAGKIFPSTKNLRVKSPKSGKVLL